MRNRANMRVAVAEEQQRDVLAPRLGRAVKFVLFDAGADGVRGAFYRVRHDAPGETCDAHAELAALLHDCQVVIAGSVGPHLARRLRQLGIEVVATPERRPAAELVARHLAGTLARKPLALESLKP
jgi:predicted Fe-Mo cluster-binding NifX family protein